LSLPAGNNSITFKFDKASFNNGLIISLISFASTLFLIGFGYYKRKS
jgi:hypothetical protein